jgi:hypothetical protein
MNQGAKGREVSVVAPVCQSLIPSAMRFTTLLFFIMLMPVMMLAHWWNCEEHSQRLLRREVDRAGQIPEQGEA